MSKILIVGQHVGGKLSGSVARAVAAAKAIGGDIEVAVFSTSGADIAAEAAKIDGVTKALHIDRAENEHELAAILAPQIVALAQSGGYSHVFVPGNTFGKDLTPRVAALLGVQQVSDIMAVHSATSFDRPIYAGNAIVTVEAPAEPHEPYPDRSGN
ncbi:MAG: electron transfer flavoprotein subunit alpha/FixB family protein, partial [Sinobacteraceae bacterium]|nr:electron transfer flavoprotein subunit alpha/FixB family protein [Nevskiaceae bacterium]